VACRNSFTRFVENCLGLLWRLNPGKRKPEVDRLWNDFDSATEENASVYDRGFEIDRFLPEPNRIGDGLKSLAKYAFLAFNVSLELCSF
jgi:hypothetical protein